MFFCNLNVEFYAFLAHFGFKAAYNSALVLLLFNCEMYDRTFLEKRDFCYWGELFCLNCMFLCRFCAFFCVSLSFI